MRNADSKLPREGETRYEVEWCTGCPMIDGDTDLDRADYHVAYFTTREKAQQKAKEVYPLDFFGSVLITPMVWVLVFSEDELYNWVYGESEHYEGGVR